MDWPPGVRSIRTFVSASVSEPDFRSTAIVFSASEYTRVTKNMSPVSFFFQSCPIWILATPIVKTLNVEAGARSVNSQEVQFRHKLLWYEHGSIAEKVDRE